MINGYDWVKDIDGGVTVCDTEGVIVYMNNKAREIFSKYGDNLVGRNLAACHNEKSLMMINKMITENISNSYTIEKNGQKKLIHQTPWYKDGKVAGLVEFSFVLPLDMNHLVR